jgi:hypothetical protein
MRIMGRPGYILMSAVFLAGVVSLIIAATVHRVQAGAAIFAGLLLATAGIMVATDIGGAGMGFIVRYGEWLQRWLPWVRSPEPYSRVLRLFVGGLAILGGLAITVTGIFLSISRR